MGFNSGFKGLRKSVHSSQFYVLSVYSLRLFCMFRGYQFNKLKYNALCCILNYNALCYMLNYNALCYILNYNALCYILNYNALCYILKSLPLIHSYILNSTQWIPVTRLDTKHFVLALQLYQPSNFHSWDGRCSRLCCLLSSLNVQGNYSLRFIN